MKLDFKLKLMIGSVVVCLSILFFNFAYALSPGLSPFGGVITKLTICTCSPPHPKIMIEYRRVKSSMPQYLTYVPSISRLYPFLQIKPGSHILGTTISPDVCIWGHKCRKRENTELIGIVGTSK